MKRGNRLAVVDRADDVRVPYDVVLLAGSPKHFTLPFAPDLAVESTIEVDGERWTVADVRKTDGGQQLICIYAD